MLEYGTLKLDTNENFAIPKKFQQEILQQARAASDVREYPQGARILCSRLSRYLRVPQDMICVGNGSDQILDIILGHVSSARTRILTSDPTFGFFEARCRLYSIKCVRVPFSDDMTLDADTIRDKMSSCDMIYLDSPNNPTGFQFSADDILHILDGFEGLVIVDEAYGEFSGSSVVKLARHHPNLAVVRTFSKAFGLAGLRLGYMVADSRLCKIFDTILQYPYPVNTIALESGIAALDRADQMRRTVRVVRSERRRMIAALKKHKAFRVFDSAANFVLFDAGDSAKRVFTALAEQGISIRNLGRIGTHRGCLRVTVGTPDMNSRFLLAIRDLLG